MTVIVGLVQNGKVYMGGDSAATAGYATDLSKTPKVIQKENILIGCCGSIRMKNLLQYSFMPPKVMVNEDPMDYMINRFIKETRKVFKEGGYLETKDGADKGGFFLVGFNGRLFAIESDFNVFESQREYIATGCGYAVANGALYATRNVEMKPEDRVRLALEAACEHDAACAGTLTILKEPEFIPANANVKPVTQPWWKRSQ